jgi:dTDP-4-amino-4,6-dideoxygalactose transaminase
MSGAERVLVEEVFDSNWIAPTGPMVDRFEAMLAELTGMGHVAALASGTAALHLALRLSDVGPGDEVWGSTMTFIGGVAPIRYVGATPVFLDIDFETMLLDLDLLEAELARAAGSGRPPAAVITTDLYGHAVDVDRMAALRDRYGFRWISDSAESVGSRFGDGHAGRGADFVVLSFNGNKIITTSGGGALASDDAAMIARARFLSTQARDPAPHYEHSTFGYNYRLSNVCAAIGVGQLQVLDDRVDARRRVNARYRELLAPVPGLTFSPEPAPMRANRWLTTVIIDPELAGFDRERARLALEAKNIESRPLWKPMHLQPVFAGLPAIGGERAERAFDLGLCLPSGSSMTDDDLNRVADTLLGLSNARR